MDERKLVARIMWANRQESRCHEHMIGFGPKELEIVFNPRRFGHLIVVSIDYDLRN